MAVNEINSFLEFYEISSPNMATIYYTTGENLYDDGVHIYNPASISRGSFSLGTDLAVPKVSVSAPPTGALLRYLANYPVVPTTVIIKRLINSVLYTIFSGKIKTVVLQGSVAVAECSSGSNILEVNIPNKICSAFCQNSLFDSDCGLSTASYLVSTTVTAHPEYLEATLFDTYADGWFTGGYVQTVSLDFRYIIFHAGPKIYLQAPFPSNETTLTSLLSVYPGCDGVYSTCEEKFNNLVPGNGKGFCGMPTVPTKNPVIWGFKGPSIADPGYIPPTPPAPIPPGDYGVDYGGF